MHIHAHQFKQASQYRDGANSAQSWATAELIVHTVLLPNRNFSLLGFLTHSNSPTDERADMPFTKDLFIIGSMAALKPFSTCSSNNSEVCM